MPLDVGPPRTPRFGSPVVLSRAHWVRRSRVLAFGRTKVAASSEAGRPKAESSIRLVAMRKPVGAWFRAKARGLFPSIGPAGIAKLSRRCYPQRIIATGGVWLTSDPEPVIDDPQSNFL